MKTGLKLTSKTFGRKNQIASLCTQFVQMLVSVERNLGLLTYISMCKRCLTPYIRIYLSEGRCEQTTVKECGSTVGLVLYFGMSSWSYLITQL